MALAGKLACRCAARNQAMKTADRPAGNRDEKHGPEHTDILEAAVQTPCGNDLCQILRCGRDGGKVSTHASNDESDHDCQQACVEDLHIHKIPWHEQQPDRNCGGQDDIECH